MFSNLNPKVVGSFVIGFALIFGAYTVTNFGEPTAQMPAGVLESQAPARVAITVTDNDKNGIEDWRDPFVDTKAIILDDISTTTYSLPTTLTGQLSISLLKNVVYANNAGPLGKNQEQVVESTADALSQQLADKIFGVDDIEIIETWVDNDIKNYANTMGGILLNAKAGEHENEVYILNDIMTKGKTERMGELEAIRNDYEMFRDESLKVPVPALFAKQHLDLINTYNALYNDIQGMTLGFNDPVVTLMRLKRYEDDALGLALSMKNMNDSLIPHSSLFSTNDPALFFTQFNQINRPQ